MAFATQIAAMGGRIGAGLEGSRCIGLGRLAASNAEPVRPAVCDRPGARPRSPRRRKSARCSLSRRDCNRCPGRKAARLLAGRAEKGDIVRIPFFTVKVRICG